MIRFLMMKLLPKSVRFRGSLGFDLDRMYEQSKAVEAEEREKGRAILAAVHPPDR